jgi:plasmid stabilization system protein ParE
MEYLVKIMPSAESNLEDIIYYIALDSPIRASKFVNELVDSISKTLAIFPEGGTQYIGTIRKISYKGYTAFYRVKKYEKLVEILHIVNLTKPLSYRGIDFFNDQLE